MDAAETEARLTMKFLYVLVSDGKDIFYEQTLVSVVSLRHYNPGASISLPVDDGTDANLMNFRDKIRDLVDEYKAVKFAKEISNKVRSRLLKTNMRNLIEGDFLYIDGDTAIADSLDAPFSEWCDVGAVADLHARENDWYHKKHKLINARIKKLNFALSLKNLYFNGGLIFAKDSPKAKEFFDKWHELYLHCVENGIDVDQLSLNEANRVLGFPLKELPGEWNCQVREAYNHLSRVKTIYPLLCRAKIIHFFGSGIDGKSEPHPLMKNEFFEKIKKEEKISDDALRIIYNAKTAFYGAPRKLDPEIRFPFFFVYRQFPRFCRTVMSLKNYISGNK